MKFSLLLMLSVLSIANGAANQSSAKPLLNPDHVYSNIGKVISLDRENDIVTCIDGVGYTWQFTECDDWQINDYVSFVMYDMNTESVTDDIIIDLHYEIIPD